MAAFLYPIFTVVSLGLVIWVSSIFQQAHSISTILLIVVLAGMTYDNLIISVGRLIGEGSLLKLLNYLRFLFHYLFVPLLVVVAVKLADDAGVAWASNPIVCKGCWALALGLVVLGLITVFRQLELAPITFAGTLRYRPKTCGLPILPVLTAFLVAVLGFYIWRETESSWMFVGTLIMLCGNALPARIFGPLISSVVDFIFILAFLATELIVH